MLLRAFSRKFSTHSGNLQKSAKTKIEQLDQYLQINGSLKLSFAWLRDHCRSPAIYDSSHHQRKFETPQETRIVSCCQVDEDKFEVVWKDGLKSSFSISTLSGIFHHSDDAKLNNPSYDISPQLWKAEDFPDKIQVQFDAYINTKSGLRKALQQIWTYGFTRIVDAPVSSEEGTKTVAERLGPIFRGTFGDLWEFGRSTSSTDPFSDTAYTNVALGAHTDATYMSQPLGIQVFHCLKEAENGGGESILADGFKIADDFRRESPEGFDFFATTPIEAEYVHTASEPHVHYFNKDVLFKTFDDGSLKQIRLNGYDRAPHQMDLETQLKFYSFYGKLIGMTKDDKYLAKFRLQPGTVLLVNNWRLLHGRTGFQGERIMSGCYISFDDFTSKSRTLGLSCKTF